ncbi:MAG: hypothetical protein P8N07_12420 [Flavobacteriales bacterium]|nr:hypothetical protein [Flavobacteriales bacterium]
MNLNRLDSYVFYSLLALTLVLLCYVSLFSEVHFEGSESIFHYFHSAAIADHPEIIVNHWGKPLFIVLSYPFTFFGVKGVFIFNSLVMILSAFFSFKFGKKLGFKFAFPLAIFVVFAPIYFRFAQSALTEPLFGLVAILSAYLFLNKKYLWSALVLSFIIFSRSEGMLFIPIYLVAFLIERKYWPILGLFFGFVVFGLIGLAVDKGFLWYYYDYPYHDSAASIYGTGPFWNYFINQEHITGTPLSYFIAGSFFFVFIKFLLKIKTVFEHKNLVFLALILIPACIYIFGHSYLWYAGKSASVGLHRIVGGVIPLLAIIAMYGLDSFIKLFNGFNKSSIIQVGILSLCCFFMLKHTFRNVSSVILVQPEPKERLIIQSIDWLKNHNLEDRKMYVFQAHYLAEFGGDHFDRNNSQIVAGIDNRSHPEEELKSGDILIWDGQNSPNEGGVFIDDLDSNENLIPLATFNPEIAYTVLGGGYYFIKIFERK